MIAQYRSAKSIVYSGILGYKMAIVYSLHSDIYIYANQSSKCYSFNVSGVLYVFKLRVYACNDQHLPSDTVVSIKCKFRYENNCVQKQYVLSYLVFENNSEVLT